MAEVISISVTPEHQPHIDGVMITPALHLEEALTAHSIDELNRIRSEADLARLAGKLATDQALDEQDAAMITRMEGEHQDAAITSITESRGQVGFNHLLGLLVGLKMRAIQQPLSKKSQ